MTELRNKTKISPNGKPGKMTYEEFLDWADEDTLAEWVDGEIEMSSPASNKHQDIVSFLVAVMRPYVEANQLGAIRPGPFQMRLPHSGREPDVIFVKNEHLDRLQSGLLLGPADLAVEVVSPESQERDRETKFGEYSEGNVPEYWLIDYEQREAIFYQLNSEGQYEAKPLDAEGKYYSSALQGFWLKPEWLWQARLPEVNDILLEVGGVNYANYLLTKMQQRGFTPPTNLSNP